jgi:hypothetical protein
LLEGNAGNVLQLLINYSSSSGVFQFPFTAIQLTLVKRKQL